MIDRKSRYAEAARASLTQADGSEVEYIVPSILSHPEDYTAAQIHRVTDSDRADILAARAYGQATAWWLIANANSAAHPDQLTEETGNELVIPMPEGMR